MREWLKQYMQFAVIGAIGTGINLFILYILTEHFKMWYIASEIIAVLVAMAWNFIGNKYWTFRQGGDKATAK